MEIYVLDENYEREHLVEKFSSFIWTERFSSYGDFQLTVEPSKLNKSILKDRAMLSMDSSSSVMVIHSTFLSEDKEGNSSYVVKGRTFESELESKILTPNGTDNKYSDSGEAGDLVINMFRHICYYGNGVSPNDIIPKMLSQNQTGVTPTVEVSLSPQELYKSMKDLCDSHGLGMEVRLRRGQEKPLFLAITKGVERTGVVFSSMLDTIAEESYLTESKEYRNVAYVYSKDDSNVEVVYAPGTSSSVSGPDRRVMIVKASDVDPTKYTAEKLSGVLQSRGKAALAEVKKNVIFDGVITSHNTFKYGVHFDLGDIVYIYDELGNKAPKVVSEYIWAWDAEGLRSYPTFVSPS